jgi:hypothetical protein
MGGKGAIRRGVPASQPAVLEGEADPDEAIAGNQGRRDIGGGEPDVDAVDQPDELQPHTVANVVSVPQIPVTRERRGWAAAPSAT